jgi:hypothetical protein
MKTRHASELQAKREMSTIETDKTRNEKKVIAAPLSQLRRHQTSFGLFSDWAKYCTHRPSP